MTTPLLPDKATPGKTVKAEVTVTAVDFKNPPKPLSDTLVTGVEVGLGKSATISTCIGALELVPLDSWVVLIKILKPFLSSSTPSKRSCIPLIDTSPLIDVDLGISSFWEFTALINASCILLIPKAIDLKPPFKSGKFETIIGGILILSTLTDP